MEYLQTQSFSSLNLIAVCPRSEKAFQLVCSTLDVDIVSLDLSGGRLDFPLRNNIVGEGVGRGLHFEIAYGDCLSDSETRRNLFGNAVGLIRATMGKNILIGSGVADALDLRAPKDIVGM